ncbi:MAG: hypothetical protein KC731_16235 [Myxococcales bacterium]|nr:hypothetical protein [Myxococcales bacterium]
MAGTDEAMAGLLRIRFEDEDHLEAITWPEFFEKFDAEELAFVYQEATAAGEISRFCKLVEGHTPD